MKLSDLNRLFFPDIQPIQSWVMRSLVRQELRYKPDEDALVDVFHDNSAYERIIQEVKERFPERVAEEQKRYNLFIEKINCDHKNASFDDFLFSFAVNGFRSDEYFLFDLPNLTLEERNNYISDRDKSIISKGLNNVVDRGDLANKHLAYRKASPLYQRDAVVLGHRGQEDIFEAFIRKHHAGVAKVSLEKEGAGISLIREEDIGEYKDYYRKHIYGKQVLMEELIDQSKDMCKFNPSTVNTVRVMAFSTRDGCTIPYSFLKMGRAGSFVDNAAAGGVFADVDTLTGEVVSSGADELGNRYLTHPDHGYLIEGNMLPDWHEALSLVNCAMSLFSTMTYVGWDLAHSVNGWVIVEGNTTGVFLPTQVARHEGIKHGIKDIISNCPSPNAAFVLERL